jgi:hypothetical protein
MSRSTVVRLPRRDDPGEHDLRDYTVRLVGSGLAGEFLCLEYLVFHGLCEARLSVECGRVRGAQIYTK